MQYDTAALVGATNLSRGKMQAYLELVRQVLEQGVLKPNRTGVDALALPGFLFEHDMAAGFPLLTTKHVPFRLIASELEFFVRGLTDKDWLRSRNNPIWDEWCSPDRVTYGHDPETRRRMSAERELGPIYGWQWRHFGAEYVAHDRPCRGEGVDQLRRLVDRLAHDPDDRRMLVSAWNPVDLSRMALPPCHYCFQVTVLAGKLNLLWNQRSVDVAIGLPFNIASYALLLHLLARQAGLAEGRLIGFLADTHIYVNHVSGLREQMQREPFVLPHLVTERMTDIFDWHHEDSRLEQYRHHSRIRFEVAV
ncbi:thymidylate synthase [Myxococcota bacterium]